MTRSTVVIFFLLMPCFAPAQVKWMNMQELDSAWQVESRPIIVFLEADWCTYCKKMEREAFSKTEIFSKLNDEYWSVKIDIEDEASYTFDGKVFKKQANKAYHDLAYLFSKEGQVPVTPTLVLLDESFHLKLMKTEYLSRKRLLDLLRKGD